MLATDEVWALRALVRLHELQSFSADDAEFLNSISAHYIKHGRKRISEKQLTWVMRKMPRYTAAIVEISDANKLGAMASEWSDSIESQVAKLADDLRGGPENTPIYDPNDHMSQTL